MAVVERESVDADRLRRFYEAGRLTSGGPVELTGVIRRAPEVTPDGFYVELEIESVSHAGAEAKATGAVELFAPVRDRATFARYEQLELRRGARVRVMVRAGAAEHLQRPLPHGLRAGADALRRGGGLGVRRRARPGLAARSRRATQH